MNAPTTPQTTAQPDEASLRQRFAKWFANRFWLTEWKANAHAIALISKSDSPLRPILDANEALRGDLAKAEAELHQFQRSFDGHVYVTNEDYGALSALAARVPALEAALRPFADAAEIKLCGEWRDDERFGQTDVSSHLTFGDLRRARATLTNEADHGE